MSYQLVPSNLSLKWLDCGCRRNRLLRNVLVAAAVIGVTIKVVKKVRLFLKKKKRIDRSLKNKDVVILHQFPHGVLAPSVSPFPLKLETYLRMANIPYENDFEDFMGPKMKCPYITLNGKDIGDSQLIIEHLNSKYGIKLNEGLDETDQAIGHALRIVAENSLYWAITLHRWVYDKGESVMRIWAWPFPARYIMPRMISPRIKRAAWCQGMGRHSRSEVEGMARKDLQTLSIILGKKKYFLGDKPREVDCAMFGMLGQLVWNFPNSYLETLVSGDLGNLKAFCLRMKEEFWPDWENRLEHQ